MCRVAGGVNVRMPARDLEQRSVPSIKHVTRRERPIEVRVIDDGDAALEEYALNRARQRSRLRCERAAGDPRARAEGVDVDLPTTAEHRDLLARKNDEFRIVERRIPSGIREEIMIGDCKKLIAVSRVPQDSSFRCAVAVA